MCFFKSLRIVMGLFGFLAGLLLLSRRVRGSNSDAKECSALMTASAEGDIEDMMRLLMHDPSLASCSSAFGETPLHLSSMSEKEEVVSLLLKYGADPNSVTSGFRAFLFSLALFAWSFSFCVVQGITQGTTCP